MSVDSNPAATIEHSARHNAISRSPLVEELPDGCLVATHRLFVRSDAADIATFLVGLGFERLSDRAPDGRRRRDFSLLQQLEVDLFEAPFPLDRRASDVLSEIKRSGSKGEASLVPYVTLAPHDMGPSGPPALQKPDDLAVLDHRAPAPQNAQAGRVTIAVLDTGLPAADPGGGGGTNGLELMHPASLVIPALSRADLEDDPLYVAGGAANDLDEPTAPGHGIFVATLAARRTPANVDVMCFRSSDHILSTGAAATPPFPIGTLLSTAEIAVDLLALPNTANLIVNMSFGGYFTNAVDMDVLKEAMMALREANEGMVFCAAAGNKADPDCCIDGTEPIYPAAYSMDPAMCEYVVSVGALTKEPIPHVPPFAAAFSGRGPWVTAWAPGVDVPSEYVPGNWENGSNVIPFPAENPIAIWSGTSFATPIVAAAIANRCLSGNFAPEAAWADLRAKKDRVVWDLNGRRHWHGAVLA